MIYVANITTNRKGKSAQFSTFDQGRLRDSVTRAVLAQNLPLGVAENFADRVVEKIDHWLHDKDEVTSSELRHQTALALATYDADTAFFYERENMLL
jgi:hypothetical protein